MNIAKSIADLVIEMTSFVNDEVGAAAYPGYDGALNLMKLPTINSPFCLPLKLA